MAPPSANAEAHAHTHATAKAKVSYRSLPHKGQLLVLMLARFTEPLTTSSIHAYMFFQLRHFDPSASPSTIAAQSGIIIGSKTAAHVCTGLVWGRLADHVLVGRKLVLVVGLLASSLATVGYGFATTFGEAIIWQVLDGALNATIAMARCMTAELNPEKRYRVRALTLLPLFANIGSLLGPLIGGFLAATKVSSAVLLKYPYAAPNICVACIQTLVAIAAIAFLRDTLDRRQSLVPLPTAQRGPTASATAHPTVSQEIDETTALLPPSSSPQPNTPPSPLPSHNSPLPFLKIWTPNVLGTLFAHFIISGHLGTFASLWAIFLSLPTSPPSAQHPPLHFSGGLGLQPHSVGIAMSAFGFAGIVLQILVYPSAQERWGTMRVWRGALCVFPVVYLIAPFCALVASIGKEKDVDTDAPDAMSVLVWIALLSILTLFAVGRTGVVPATTLLINECTPHPSVRGTLHTTGVIVSNLSRSVFPPIAFAVLGYGLRIGVVGLGFWFVAALAVLSCFASLRVREGANGEFETGAVSP